MKGKHFVSIKKKNNWFIVFVNSEVISIKEPVAKFINAEEAWNWAYEYADALKIDMAVVEEVKQLFPPKVGVTIKHEHELMRKKFDREQKKVKK